MILEADQEAICIGTLCWPGVEGNRHAAFWDNGRKIASRTAYETIAEAHHMEAYIRGFISGSGLKLLATTGTRNFG